MDRRNCWEVKGCGREPGGEHADSLGVCPASSEERLHGVHGGHNAGRACWAVKDTPCADACGSATHDGMADCIGCDFYRGVLEDEMPHIVYTPAILALLEADRPTTPWLRPPAF